MSNSNVEVFHSSSCHAHQPSCMMGKSRTVPDKKRGAYSINSSYISSQAIAILSIVYTLCNIELISLYLLAKWGASMVHQT